MGGLHVAVFKKTFGFQHKTGAKYKEINIRKKNQELTQFLNNLCHLNYPLPRRRSEDNIKMDLQEVGGGVGDWMEQVRIGTGGVPL
jgi:hypothetical protein